MLTEFQTEKLTHFYNLLDYNKNGEITIEDFLAVAENLCVLWGFREGSEDYKSIIERCTASWHEFIKSANPGSTSATLEEWIAFADKHIVNTEIDLYKTIVTGMVGEMFDYFDADGDQEIDLDEYVDMFMAFRIEIRYSAKSFTKLDLNGDMRLSKGELLRAVAQYFRSRNKEDGGNWLFGFWED
jgi:Ca2+-binding EF-hand superfamily protein